MKKKLALFVTILVAYCIAQLMSGCAQYSCPTYSDSNKNGINHQFMKERKIMNAKKNKKWSLSHRTANPVRHFAYIRK